ncbi:MAG: tRNA 2-selenouridine(34) synthase MnmH [Bacteroidetes bacterium]|nr:tRNA 2-selenouridine(34) synthase MnmH [Bacteroidota bacterium]MCB0850680.1 tRNA 2-selenouridine(34) synthase MnmH [Bacteroidota bacterium]
MFTKLPISSFLNKFSLPLIDVRSPAEFHKGHIPGSTNIPIFSNEERKIIGTLYKQQGREQALLHGLDLVGPKMSQFVTQAKKLDQGQGIAVHCWRGGMRSESMALLWKMAGIKVNIIQGGYKAYRQQIHEDFAKPFKLLVVSGKTGSGKTDILKELQNQGEQIIELEGIANHKGSAFGALGQDEQPTVEQFENNLHHALSQLDPNQQIWIEDESHSIGQVYIPLPFWHQMKASPALVVEIPQKIRIERLIKEYAEFPPELLQNAVERIKKRLGGKNVKEAIAALDQKNFSLGTEIALNYYDKAYLHHLKQRAESQIHRFVIPEDYPEKTATKLINYCQQHLPS